MSINPADSAIFGSLYGTDEIRALFSDRASLQFMLDVEAALARAEAKLGLVPEALAESITRAARAENLRLDYIADSTRRIGYPVAAIVKELGRVAERRRPASSILVRRLRIFWTPRWSCNCVTSS